MDINKTAHEIWAMAQLMPKEGIEDGVERVKKLLNKEFIKTNKNKINELTQFHYHEIIDRSSVATDHFHEYVENHPAVMSNEELKKKAEEVTTLMYEFYNLCSKFSDTDKRAIKYKED